MFFRSVIQCEIWLSIVYWCTKLLCEHKIYLGEVMRGPLHPRCLGHSVKMWPPRWQQHHRSSGLQRFCKNLSENPGSGGGGQDGELLPGSERNFFQLDNVFWCHTMWILIRNFLCKFWCCFLVWILCIHFGKKLMYSSLYRILGLP